jgi:redox-sensitive bicupin YhaK (pirin superfamily)
MITVRQPDEIYQAQGEIERGTFHGRWHFAFDQYRDPEHVRFGSLRVFNDDTLSPGAVWPLHRHRNIEVVTYCAAGEFRHADQNGLGGVLKEGWVQHTEQDLKPSVEQKPVAREERLNRFLPLVSNEHAGALPIHSNAQLHACFLEAERAAQYSIDGGWEVYLYVLEGGPVQLDGHRVPARAAAQVTQERALRAEAEGDAELLLVNVRLT